MRNHGPDTVNVALYVSPCCADIERNRSKKGGFFLQETMPCIHGPSLCVCMLALVVAVLIAYDYECGRKLSASLFLGSQNQAFLASWLWALIVYKMLLAPSYSYHLLPRCSPSFVSLASLSRQSSSLTPSDGGEDLKCMSHPGPAFQGPGNVVHSNIGCVNYQKKTKSHNLLVLVMDVHSDGCFFVLENTSEPLFFASHLDTQNACHMNENVRGQGPNM